MLVLSETLKCFDSLLVEISFDDLVVTLVRKLNGARIIIDYYSININGNWVMTTREMYALSHAYDLIRMKLEVEYQRNKL